MQAQEFQAGPNQLIVVYVNDDSGSMIEPAGIWEGVAEDAAGRAAEGWRILSTAVSPMRQMGTAGNILFQSGGQYATQVGVTVVYART